MKSVRHFAKKSISHDLFRWFFCLFFVGFISGIILFPLFTSISHLVSFRDSSEQVKDPYTILQGFRKGKQDFLLVDVRSKRDFEKAHIKTAVSFPLYEENGEVKNITGSTADEFIRQYRQKNSVVVYAQFSGSQPSKDFAAVLRQAGVQASPLAIGWNEWRHFRNLWVPESQWDEVQVEEFIEGN